MDIDLPNFELDEIKEDSFWPDWMDDIPDDQLIHEAETAEQEIEYKAKERETSRFATLTDDDLTRIISNAEAKGTKKNTKWIVNLIQGKYIIQIYGYVKVLYHSTQEVLFCLHFQDSK